MIPVRCQNCNRVIGNLWDIIKKEYLEAQKQRLLQEDMIFNQSHLDIETLQCQIDKLPSIWTRVFAKLRIGSRRVCCRTAIMTSCDLPNEPGDTTLEELTMMMAEL